MTLLTTAQQELMQCPDWVCPICHRSHDDTEYEGDDESVDPNATYRAAHCCLWKTFGHAERVRIAERVEAGANWADAIQGEPS